MKYLIAILIGILLTIRCYGQDAAQGYDNVQRMTVFEGKCRVQILAGFFPCKPGVLFTEFKNNRWALMFSTSDGVFNIVVSGGSDRQPNLENYYVSADRFYSLKGRDFVFDDQGIEGECHFLMNKKATRYFHIKCDIYNRKTGTHPRLYLENIQSFKRKFETK